MKVGTVIYIIPSPALTRMGLSSLEGVRGTIVSAKRNGCWVKLPVRWKREIEWFIPNESISAL